MRQGDDSSALTSHFLPQVSSNVTRFRVVMGIRDTPSAPRSRVIDRLSLPASPQRAFSMQGLRLHNTSNSIATSRSPSRLPFNPRDAREVDCAGALGRACGSTRGHKYLLVPSYTLPSSSRVGALRRGWLCPVAGSSAPTQSSRRFRPRVWQLCSVLTLLTPCRRRSSGNYSQHRMNALSRLLIVPRPEQALFLTAYRRWGIAFAMNSSRANNVEVSWDKHGWGLQVDIRPPPRALLSSAMVLEPDPSGRSCTRALVYHGTVNCC